MTDKHSLAHVIHVYQGVLSEINGIQPLDQPLRHRVCLPSCPYRRKACFFPGIVTLSTSSLSFIRGILFTSTNYNTHKRYVNIYFRKFDTYPPPPGKDDNVEPYTFVTLVLDICRPPSLHYVTLESPLQDIGRRVLLNYITNDSKSPTTN